MKKIAVILFNLGGPDSKESIRPFLLNFFMDKNIIRLPYVFRYVVAQLISRKRSKNEAGKSYNELGDRSPLLENTEAQAEALEKILNVGDNNQFKVFVSMRYWHPMAEEITREVKLWGADQVVLLPLYPQFSTTTTRSSFGSWKRAVRKKVPTSGVCCYPFNEGFIKASAENVKTVYEQALKDGYKNPRVLFSAHGLPENVIKDGDPYQWQCEEGARLIAEALNIPNLDWSICYQSRVGPMKWIGPSTEEELHRASKDQKSVVIYPHAFTQEHVETLVEIELEYRELAHEIGVPGFYRVPTVSTHPVFIEALANIVKDKIQDQKISSDTGKKLCPQNFKRCCMVNSNV